MALNGSGQISMGGSTAGQSINLEMGYSATATISLNDTAIRGLGGKASGAISLSDFWGKTNAITVDYVIVSGGGAGGNNDAKHAGGGGGAGGMIGGTVSIGSGTYVVTVGSGGGQSSINGFGHVTVYAGGRGGTSGDGGAGGSGGGGSSDNTGPGGNGGAGTAGQGNGGGAGNRDGYAAGGGGGKGSGGNNPDQPYGGTGGTTTIRGATETFASGGNGGVYSSSNPGPGAANTGNGGGGGGNQSGKSGGSGIVIIAYPGTVAKASGGTINTTSRSGWVVHTFTSSGTFTK